MKLIFLIFIITIPYSHSLAQQHSTLWQIRKIKTNYIQRGVNDKFELPYQLKGKYIQIEDSLLKVAEVRKNILGSALSDEFSDTIILEKKIFFKRVKNNAYSLQYPGDEFTECVQNNKDTCTAGETFLNLLKVKNDGVNAYLSSSGKDSKTKCILFILENNNEAILFSENDFLILFLTKKKTKI